MRRRAVAGSAVAAVVLLTACSPQRSHLFSAHRYDPSSDCLEPGAAVDVLEGPDRGCDAVRCWISPDGDVYVSTSCDAPPDFEDHTHDPAPSLCASALAAWTEGDAGRCAD